MQTLTLEVRCCAAPAALLVLMLAGISFGILSADPVPRNLANGLYDVIVDSQSPASSQHSLIRKPTPGQRVLKFAVKDKQGRIMVDIHLDGSKSIGTIHKLVAAEPEAAVVAVDRSFQAGTIEAYVTPSAAVRLATQPGIASISLVWKPQTQIGAVTTQGFVQHRVDQIAGKYDGTGIKIAALSDSYDSFGANGVLPDAAADIATGDLPGPGNPYGNITPVTVLEDSLYNGDAGTFTDEGRAMLQIVEDLAPNAQLGFATGIVGEVDFANNIRALKDTFGADVICDDIIYFDEPMFQDGILAQAVDYVASKGVSYFSAAGNAPAIQSYVSTFRPVPLDPANPQAALKGTNINLTGVDPSLYAGGFHNFRTDGGQDIAQKCEVSTDAIVLQWNDPYAFVTDSLGRTVLDVTGDITNPTSRLVYSFTVPANTLVRIDAGETNVPPPIPFAVQLSLIDPDGNEIFSAIANPFELFPTVLPLQLGGKYTIVVTAFQNNFGNFYVKVNEELVTPAPQITSNFNILFFDPYGTYQGAVSGDALAPKQPILLGSTPDMGIGQLVIARSNIPKAAHPADQIRYRFLYSSYSLNYNSYLTPTTYGHCVAQGANGIAAYSAFRPFIPEAYCSPGPATIYFDVNGHKLASPQVRQRPNFAGMDGAFTTFFGGTTTQDASAFPNFFGTSAAAPHAAAIAGLVIQAHGGSGSVTPDQMRDVLQRSTFPHSLTPYYASGTAVAGGSKVLVQVKSDNSYFAQFNPDQFTVQLSGTGAISSLTINLTDANPTGGNIYNRYPGEIFFPEQASYSNNYLGYPFTVSPDSVGIGASDVTASFSGQAGPPSVPHEYYQLNLKVARGKLGNGAVLQFGVARHEQHSSYYASATGTGGGDSSGGGTANLMGEGVSLPGGQIIGPGATFSGTLEDGTQFSGVFTDAIGAGWTPLDGYGFINAQEAVGLPLSK
ncbi:MAG: S8 family serine peptidase [Verrucomicrobia bacterium]|nr:S8 family serine peptidase [Verrucomicrobiota bacterium]